MKFVTFTILLFAALALSGCRKEEPNPELLDPIYVDLDKRANDSQKAYDEEVKKQVDLKAALEKAEPNSIELKNAERDLAKSEHSALFLDQNARYYRIRAKRRALVDKLTYKEAFSLKKPWPDPHEYSDYLVNTRLNEVNLNWNARVPKLQSRLEKPPPKVEKGKEGGEKPE